METDEKKCLRCAEIVKAEATACRFCGFEFGASAQPRTSAGAQQSVVKSPASLPKKLGIGCLGVVGFLIVLGALGGRTVQVDSEAGANALSESTDAVAQPIATTPSELVNAYKANEASAQQRFGSAPLRVTGVIKSINLGIGDEPFLVLKSGEMFSDPQAELDSASAERAGDLAKGQSVTLLCGSISEVIGTPMLKDCAIQ